MKTAITKTCSIFFSPTHTSQKVANAVAKGTGVKVIEPYNLTTSSTAPVHIASDTLAVFAVPVYGGHIPSIAADRLKQITGENTPAIAIVVYGNRDYEHALEEFATFLKQQGFMVVAGATFIGEHSYSNEQYPIAAGRPNGNDLQIAASFGKRVIEKLLDNEAQEIDVTAIKRPEQSEWSTQQFVAGVMQIRSSQIPMQATPLITDASACTHCGACAKSCPTQAIPLGDELSTDTSRCIRCCACVKACPQHLRSYETPFAPLLSTYYSVEKEPQTIY